MNHHVWVPPAEAIIALATLACAFLFASNCIHIAGIDYVLLVCILAGLLLWAARLEHAPLVDAYVDGPADPVVTNIVPIDTEAFAKLATLPSEARGLLEPPLDALVQSAKGNSNDEGDKPENLEPLAVEPYQETRDPYVGDVARVAKKDIMGNTTVEDVYTIDEARFEAMKIEYKRLDTMLATLRRVSPTAYAALVESTPPTPATDS